jgi:hypothetical protein
LQVEAAVVLVTLARDQEVLTVVAAAEPADLYKWATIRLLVVLVFP